MTSSLRNFKYKSLSLAILTNLKYNLAIAPVTKITACWASLALR